jgi:hypothetical protein
MASPSIAAAIGGLGLQKRSLAELRNFVLIERTRHFGRGVLFAEQVFRVR